MEKFKCKDYPDLIRTIHSDEEIPDFSDDSDDDVKFQPTKRKRRPDSDMDPDFNFFVSEEEYHKDTWNDLAKYVKRKAKSKTDDKIKKVREQAATAAAAEEGDDGAKVEPESDASLSDDELVHDRVMKKQKPEEKKKKKKRKGDRKEVEEKPVEDEKPYEDENVSFYQMNLSRPLLKAVSDMNFVHPTPIQVKTIPLALEGRDICGRAATGTGKTAAYMLPILERLLFRPVGPASVTRVLVLVPTRELGVQVYQVTRQLARYTNVQAGLAVGGLDLKAQEAVLRRNPDVVIATPGRLIDHLRGTPTFGLDGIEILVLDEADRMLDEHFAEQMKEIVKRCARTRQTMLFSATMTQEVENLASVSLSNPVNVFVDSNRDVAFNLRQEFVRIRDNREADREAILAALVCRTFREHCMVFVQTKKQAHRLHILLGLLGLRVAELHGNLTQPQRLEALQRFKDEAVDFLVATDVASRGLDIHGVQTVVNFEMPATVDHYIHRVGRTARAGKAGVSVSLAGERERKIVKELVRSANSSVLTRGIPQDVLDKYRARLEGLEPQVAQIMQEEYEERLLRKTENQANRLEKKLKGETPEVRPWFQTKKQRQDEKEKLSQLAPKAESGNKGRNANATAEEKKAKKKSQKKGNMTPEEKKETDKMKWLQKLQARQVKGKAKPKRMRTVEEDAEEQKKPQGKKRKRSNFDVDLSNTSQKKAKKLRYDANFTQKMKSKEKSKRQKGGSKSFGKQQQKKMRR